MFEAMNVAILVGAGLITVATFTSLVSVRIGAPLLLLFLGIGLGAGEDGLGGIAFDDARTAYTIGSLALAMILFDSGFNTPLRTARPVLGPALVLATLGVVLTAGLVAVAVRELLGLSWLEGLLLGAIVASTDAAAVSFLLRVGGITIRERVRATLELESGTNDPMAIFMTVTLVGMVAAGVDLQTMGGEFTLAFIQQMGLGLIGGALGGLAIILAVNRLKLEAGLYPIIVLSLALCVFAATGLGDGSGFLAVYVAGVIAGNSRLKALPLLRRFQDGMTWFSQIAMFVTLGLLATPSQFAEILVPGVGIALLLTFVARPVAVLLCLAPFGFRPNELAFISFVGLRGAVSILLAILPMVDGLANGKLMFNVAFVVVLVSLVVQGWTIRPLARRLGLLVPRRIGPVDRVELELPGRARHELVVYRIAAGSPVARGERIPRWARPSLIVRDGRSVRSHEAGRLQPQDYVYIFAPPQHVPLLDRLFARPAALDPEDRAIFGDFIIEPATIMLDLVEAYGLPLEADSARLSVGEYVTKRLNGAPEPGDRVAVGGTELIVREMTADGKVGKLGLAVDPLPAMRPATPLRRGVSRWLRWLRRREDRPDRER